MLMEHDLAPKKRHDGLKNTYASGVVNQDICHENAEPHTTRIPTTTRITTRDETGTNDYHMDTLGKNHGNRRGPTPPPTKRNPLRKPVAKSTPQRNGARTSPQTSSIFPPAYRKKNTCDSAIWNACSPTTRNTRNPKTYRRKTPLKTLPKTLPKTPPKTIGVVAKNALPPKQCAMNQAIANNLKEWKQTNPPKMKKNIFTTTLYTAAHGTSDTSAIRMHVYGKNSFDEDTATPALLGEQESPSPCITTQTNPGPVAMTTTARSTSRRRKEQDISRNARRTHSTLGPTIATLCIRKPVGAIVSTLTVPHTWIRRKLS